MDLLDKNVTNLSFEQAFERLNKVVELIEGGDVSLEESIKYYEIGILLKNHCEEKLKNAETKIKKVVDNKVKNIDEKRFQEYRKNLKEFFNRFRKKASELFTQNFFFFR